FLYRHLVPAQDWVVTITGERRDKFNFTVLADEPVKLIPGKPAHVRIACPLGLAEKGIKLVLSQPPKGVKIKKVLPDQRGLRVEFDVDEKLAKPGEKGNLIAIGSLKYTSIYYSSSKSKRKGKRERKTYTRTMSFGALPAIPFELLADPKAVPKAE
nr:hypothetical protein [Phycisphaerae bacterium]